MRSSAGIVAGLFLIGLVANCGGDDSGGSTPTAGTTSHPGAGEGGENTGATSSGGTNATAGTNAKAGEGGMAATGCTKDADCGATAKCMDGTCLKNDGEACTEQAECQHNCIDSVCTGGLEDGKDCTADEDCAHTCIDNVCAPASDVGGDCDAALGAGGAGGAPAVGPVAAVGGGGEGGAAPLPQAHDCVAPLQCYAGKCLTPDGEPCKENVDCINTCVDSVCKTKSTLKEACDDTTDCLAGMVCSGGTCKLDLKQRCNDNAQCDSTRCLCADVSCTIRTCKTKDSSCQCRWSQEDSESCTVGSAPLKLGSQDPNGCAANSPNWCDGKGQCVANTGGDCKEPCAYKGPGQDGKANTSDDVCQPGAITSCNAGYHGVETSSGDCRPVAVKVYQADGVTFDHYDYPCQAACTCEAN